MPPGRASSGAARAGKTSWWIQFGAGGRCAIPKRVKTVQVSMRRPLPSLNNSSIRKEATGSLCQLIWRLGKSPTVINNPCVLAADFPHQTKGLKSCC